ncbi:sulfotransferase family protein [Lacimonas salitolerans]|uniref:Sulfotransferase family protein n=1 Tax=Lacimonas salitolerans TaxID=1323750 RepID=A0ABW4EH97_9RHOB
MTKSGAGPMTKSSAGPKIDPNIIEGLLSAKFPRVNYLTHIDNNRRLVYVETPKVACTSIKKFMMDQYVGGVFDLPNVNDVHRREISPLKQLTTLSPEEAKAIWSKEYRRFSFVRNPFARLLSGYLDKLVTNEFERQRHLPMMGFAPDSKPTLVEFLERLVKKSDAERDIHFATQSSLLMVDAVEYDYIGRFEGFKEDFLRLQATFYGIDHPTESYEVFGRHHASNAHEKIFQYYGPKEIELVREIYQTDFRLFGYSEAITQASHCEQPVKVEQLSLKLPSAGSI